MSKKYDKQPDEIGDPVNNVIEKNLEIYFKKEMLGNKEPEKEITYPKYMSDVLTFDGKIIPLDSVIKPSKDQRLIKFYNIAALLKVDKTKISTKSFGTSTGNIPIRIMLDYYLDGMCECCKILNSIKESGITDINEKLIKISTEFIERCDKGDLKQDIQRLAENTGLSFEMAKEAYSNIIVSEQLIKTLSEDVESREKWYKSVTNSLVKYCLPISSFLVSGGIGAALGWFGPEIGAIIGTALFPGVGTVVGGIAGFAVAMGLSFISGFSIGYFASKVKSSFVEMDKETEKQKDVIIDCSKTKLLQQKALNYAMLLRQMLHYFVNEPSAVSDSNIFVTAIDERNFFDLEELKKTHDYKTAIEFSEIPNHGSWCEFKNMKNLINVPRAEDFKTKDNRTIKNLIDIFKAASVCENQLDFEKLKRLALGEEIPTPMIVITSNMVQQIKMYVKKGIDEDTIVEFIQTMNKDVTRQQILDVISEQRETMLMK